MRRIRSTPWALLLLSAGCRSDNGIADLQARLAVNPPLLDLGDVAIGATLVGALDVDHLGGPEGHVRNVSVVPLGGSAPAFVYTGPDAVTVPRGDSVALPIAFTPTEPGWFVAHVTVTHDGLASPAELDVRGHGVFVDLATSPMFVDFGPVPAGDVGARDVTVENLGAADVTLGDVTFSHPAFALAASAPLVVPAGRSLVLPLRFAPVDDLPVGGELVIGVAATALPPVTLRGNDCERGDPAVWDADGDGVTACGGDCDDGDASARPGATEPVTADGVDQDCDGTVDEGTTAVDDDGDGVSEDQGDCNDGRADVYPGATEIPGNGVDDDCDGTVDSGSTDADFDGWDPIVGGDCDDADPTVFPGAPEQPDGVDDDCDGAVDEGTTAFDDDGDGYCESACTDGSLPGDCDDGDATAYPGATETPDWRDDDCDGAIDEGTVHADDDGDGWSEDGGDCDDADPLRNPGRGNCP